MAERNVHFKGLSELSKFMEQLAPKMEANVMRAALSAGAKVVRDVVVTNCPVGEPSRKNREMYGAEPGDLQKTIRYGSRIKQRAGKVTAYVRAGGRVKGTNRKVYWAVMAEYGTQPHMIGKWLHPGARANAYARPALDAESEHALAVIANFIKNRLEQKHGLDTSAVVLGDE